VRCTEAPAKKGFHMKKLFLLSVVLLLSACGSKLDGTYADKNGMLSYTFKSNGKTYQSAMGMEVELDYEVDGNKIKLVTPQGNMIMTLLDDGSIESPMGILTKQKK
jgi:outer membrane lipopolysaccharide assembly protein LptE/RlpB